MERGLALNLKLTKLLLLTTATVTTVIGAGCGGPAASATETTPKSQWPSDAQVERDRQVYAELAKVEAKNKALEADVKELTARVEELEAQAERVNELPPPPPPPPKPPARRTAADEAKLQAELASYTKGIAGKGVLLAQIKTSMGTLHCELYPEKTPLTVANFVGLATGKKEWSRQSVPQRGRRFYDGLTFHRVIPGFMIQGGDPNGNGTGGPEFMFENEIAPGLYHVAGALAMANAGADTNGSQFFITEVARPELDGGYTVFGRCAELDLIARIATVERDERDKPLKPVVIKTITFSRGRGL